MRTVTYTITSKLKMFYDTTSFVGMKVYNGDFIQRGKTTCRGLTGSLVNYLGEGMLFENGNEIAWINKL